MRARHFRSLLQSQSQRPLPASDVPSLPPRVHAPLLRSLQKFHLGESGEGRVAHEIDHVTWSGADADLRALVKLWVREEGRHARILGQVVTALGGRPLRRHWTERGFSTLRRAFGVRVKLLVALAAEVAGTVFYGALAERLPGSELATALQELESDERVHLAFQSELFGMFGAESLLGYAAIQLAWLAGALATCCLVVAEHGETLAVLGLPRAPFFVRLWKLSCEVARRIADARAQERSVAQAVVS